MYAITHAATALLLKRRFPQAGLRPLLLSVQAVELLWVITGILVAALAWLAARARADLHVATAVAFGVFSHIILDVIHELLYGFVCWLIFRGSVALLSAIVILNLLDTPFMFPRPGTGAFLAEHPAALPTVILGQIVVTWIAVWLWARRKA